jgi:predicted secreted hydrolase
VISNYPITDILRNDDDGNFARALSPRTFSFPQDYGAHNNYRTEWWYFTGNLKDDQEREFGYQLTFFRYSLASTEQSKGSAWRSRQIYMAHFALSDVEDNRLYAFERFSRAAAGLAGAKSDGLNVWLDNWTAKSEKISGFPLRLRAKEKNIAIDLILEQGKPVVLQGDKGLSIKNSEFGNASYYYSFTRMPSSGTIFINGDRKRVSGSSWMDHEWSSSALGQDQIGWDWFALQLSDGSELMLYRFRRKDSKTDPFSYGVLVSPTGNTQTLKYNMIDIDVKNEWQSPRDGSTYPAQWHIHIPGHELKLDVWPAIADQELDLSFRYWEGAVRLSGSKGNKKITGQGYVELTGYVNNQFNPKTRSN